MTNITAINATIRINYTTNNLLVSIKYNNSKIFLNFQNNIFIYSIGINSISKIFNYSHSANNITYMDMKIIDNYVMYSSSNTGGVGYIQIPNIGLPFFGGYHSFSINIYCFTIISGYLITIGDFVALFNISNMTNPIY